MVNSQEKTTTILIRTKNEARSIAETLEAVLAQNLKPHEIFVIDSGSKDATLQIAAGYPVRILTLDPKLWNYSRALNLGASNATGDFLVCLSAHCSPIDRNWLANLLGHFDDSTVAAVWGPNHFRGRDFPQPGPAERQELADYTVENRLYGMTNSNSALRRSLWEQFHFDETMPATEDKAWAREAMARGYSIIYDPKAAVWHPWHPGMYSLRRNRAVMAGYVMMFPELGTAPTNVFAAAGGRLWRRVVFHATTRDAASLKRDLRNAPSILFGMIGTLIGSRGRRIHL